MAYETVPIKQIADTTIVTIENGKQLFVDKFLSLLPLNKLPGWQGVLIKIGEWVFDKFIFPWMIDCLHWMDVHFIHKAVLEQKIKVYKEADDEHFDEAFDDLIGVPEPK